MKDWIYDEFKYVGVDYSETSKANVYDEEMESFRDYDNEVKALIDKLSLVDTKKMVAVDIGCGTGAFAIHAAKCFKKVYAVDVSAAMLEIAQSKANSAEISNIEFFNSGFLNFECHEQVDLVCTKWAFHHLPDYWKQAALLNINKMLKPDGIFFLSDVVFKFDAKFEENTDIELVRMSNEFDEAFVDETKTHIREEYSTFDWILKGMIERAGFRIEKSNTDNWIESEYVCRKIKSYE